MLVPTIEPFLSKINRDLIEMQFVRVVKELHWGVLHDPCAGSAIWRDGNGVRKRLDPAASEAHSAT